MEIQNWGVNLWQWEIKDQSDLNYGKPFDCLYVAAFKLLKHIYDVTNS